MRTHGARARHGGGEISVTAEDLARRLAPVLGERGLELRHHGAGEMNVGVAPVIVRSAGAAPLPAHARAARDADHAVGDEHAAMVTMIALAERQPSERAERRHLTAGLVHRLHVLPRHPEGSDRVEQDLCRHALPAALGDRVGDLGGDRPVLVEVLRVRQCPPGFTDHAELGGKDLLSVEEDPDVVAVDDRSARMRRHGGGERGIGHRELGEAVERRRPRRAGHEQRDEQRDGDHGGEHQAESAAVPESRGLAKHGSSCHGLQCSGHEDP